MPGIRIESDDLTRTEVIDLLNTHTSQMAQGSPADSVHALSVDELRQPGVSFFSAWIEEQLAGCIGMQELDRTHAEVKSTHTAAAFRGQGVAAGMLEHLIDVAIDRGYRRLSLETGSAEQFLPARQLYERFGFSYCAPFANYVEDPYSVFMTRELQAR